ncbi:MAG: tRNA pseudouridine(55) synthase TruB [Oscillospiraceae bacterium]|nr:tRNA pseudouridine(55) synthase TruB [Oscillospiraceae bacterium]
MNGIIIIDKPTGWTSHDVVAKLRSTLKIKRIGHGGTLDPMATGVLPVFIGRATRAAQFIENANKVYTAGLRLGIITDTQDITGQILSSTETSVNAADITATDIKKVFHDFLGVHKQIPPMYSAIKVDGKKLYELARRGEEVSRPARDIEIFSIEYINCIDGDYYFHVECSKGTYIRTLCHDMGAALGCGGVLSSLRRTRAGAFSIESSHKLDDVLAASDNGSIEDLLLPIDSLFQQHPSLMLDEMDTKRCKNGAAYNLPNYMDGIYRFYGPDNEFLLLGELNKGKMKTIKSFFEVNS